MFTKPLREILQATSQRCTRGSPLMPRTSLWRFEISKRKSECKGYKGVIPAKRLRFAWETQYINCSKYVHYRGHACGYWYLCCSIFVSKIQSNLNLLNQIIFDLITTVNVTSSEVKEVIQYFVDADFVYLRIALRV